jgi:cbb3-type cytochrome oxidase subunit 3
MTALTQAFVIAAVLCFLAAVFSALRGKKYVYSENGSLENKTVTKTTSA